MQVSRSLQPVSTDLGQILVQGLGRAGLVVLLGQLQGCAAILQTGTVSTLLGESRPLQHHHGDDVHVGPTGEQQPNDVHVPALTGDVQRGAAVLHPL